MSSALEDSELLVRIRMEFLEMPGMRLTRSQAQRLWNLSQTASSRVLEALVEQGFLKEAGDGSFLRRWSGRLEKWHSSAYESRQP